jgi:hypothetical protein
LIVSVYLLKNDDWEILYVNITFGQIKLIKKILLQSVPVVWLKRTVTGSLHHQRGNDLRHVCRFSCRGQPDQVSIRRGVEQVCRGKPRT